VNQGDAWNSTIDPATAYPGDAYVDIIGMDFYYNPEWDGTDPLAAWNAMVSDKYGLQWHQDFAAAHNKPTAYSEWGIKSDNAGPYIQKAAEWFSSHNVLYNNYWETDAAAYPGDLSHYPTASQVFRDVFGPTTAPVVTAPAPAPLPAPVSDEIAHWIVGDGQNNTLTGTDSNDYLNGSGGNDILTGRAGNDVYAVDTVQDQIVETSGGGIDRVESWAGSYTLPNWVEHLLLCGSYTQTGIGNGLANQITGGSGANVINGQAGDDFLNGKAGNDTLTGGTGKDIFVLDTSANRDTLTDFNVTDDSIYLDNAVFQKIGEGTSAQPLLIKADTFLIGDRARDANDYLIYSKDKGALYYDADGSGASAPVQIAALSKNLAMTYKDFFVI
jgi:hypothetical protein